MSEAINDAFHRSVDDGVQRLERSTPELMATGVVGGADVTLGVFAFLLVEYYTHNHLLAALGFGIGFLALTLAHSELFTENFLVPISTVAAKKAKWRAVLRLWVGTAVFNVVGVMIFTYLVMNAFPELRQTAITTGLRYIDRPLDWATFLNAVLAGAVITLMTWMQRATNSVGSRLVATWSIAFLFAAAPLQHSIVLSAEAFAALHSGAPFGYLDCDGHPGLLNFLKRA